MKSYLFILSSVVILFSLLSLTTAPHTVSGTVIHITGISYPYPDGKVPLAGVDVIVKGTNLGTQTDLQGRYYLTLPKGNDTLLFSHVGFPIQKIAVENRSVINVTFETVLETR